jgi:hypothetical protein
MLVVLRIAAVRSDIGDSLTTPAHGLAGSIEKDAFTSLLCLVDCSAQLGSRHVRCVTAPAVRSESSHIGSSTPMLLCVFGWSTTTQRIGWTAFRARYSQTIVAAASPVISDVS